LYALRPGWPIWKLFDHSFAGHVQPRSRKSSHAMLVGCVLVIIILAAFLRLAETALISMDGESPVADGGRLVSALRRAQR